MTGMESCPQCPHCHDLLPDRDRLTAEQLLRLEALRLADARINSNANSRTVLTVTNEWATYLTTGELPTGETP